MEPGLEKVPANNSELIQCLIGIGVTLEVLGTYHRGKAT